MKQHPVLTNHLPTVLHPMIVLIYIAYERATAHLVAETKDTDSNSDIYQHRVLYDRKPLQTVRS